MKNDWGKYQKNSISPRPIHRATGRASRLDKRLYIKDRKVCEGAALSTLAKIAVAMNTDITLLITTNSETAQDISLSVVKADERRDVTTIRGHHYEALAYKKLGKNMEPYIITPTLEVETVFSHEGEEFMYVLEGTHELNKEPRRKQRGIKDETRKNLSPRGAGYLPEVNKRWGVVG
jgi:hypothetical protein